MPTNEELEKQVEELRKLVAENREATNTRWSDSTWAIGLQILIAIAAVAIAWAQFNAAAIQTELSTKQTRLQEFEIIKSLSNLRPNDSIAVDNLFGYIATLDKELQQKFIDNNLKSSSINYFTYQSYLYLFENFEFDTVSVVGDIMTKVASQLKEKRFDHITNPEYAREDHQQVITWTRMVLDKVKTLDFPSYQKLMSTYSTPFITGTMLLQEIIDYQRPAPSKLRDDVDTAFLFKMIPFDINLVSGLYGPMIGSSRSVTPSIRQLVNSNLNATKVTFFSPDQKNIETLLTENYSEDLYKVFLLYLREAGSLEDFREHKDLCVKLIETQKTLRGNLKSGTYQLPGMNKEFVYSYRLWLNAEKLVKLKKAADAGEPYEVE